MPINTENFEKNEAVKKFLADFLKQLKIKRSIALREQKRLKKHKMLGRSSAFLIFLDIGIDVIKKIQFESIDDFNSVKNIKEAELFFSKTYLLKKIEFPDYKSQIAPFLLCYIDIEMQLDLLDKQALDLLKRGYRLAGENASLVVMSLRNLNDRYFNEKKIDYDDYKSTAFKLIEHAQSLSKHLAYEKILGNLLLLVVTLGTAFVYNKAVNGHFLFFRKTEVAEQLAAINQIVSTANHLSA